MSQVWNDYQQAAREHRIKECGYDPLEMTAPGAAALPSQEKTADGELSKAMLRLAAIPGCLFVGQGVRFGGVATSKALEGVPAEQLVEFPVAEDLQLGFCVGLALRGFLPVCVFPRMDFMLRAADQLVNHLDKLEAMTAGAFRPKVIIRTRVGQRRPLDAGPQHTQNHCEALGLMLTSVVVEEIEYLTDVEPAYKVAAEHKRSVIVVENLPCS